MNAGTLGFAGGPAAHDVYAFHPQGVWIATASLSDTSTPDPAADTQIPGLSLAIYLPTQCECLVTVSLRATKSGGGSRVKLYLDGAAVTGTWYSTDVGEADVKQTHFSERLLIGPGSHTLAVYWNAAVNTNAITWLDRHLIVEALTQNPV